MNKWGAAETVESIRAVWDKIEANDQPGAKRVATASKAAQYFGKGDTGGFAFYLILDKSPTFFTEIAVIEQTVELRQDGRHNFKLELAQPEFKAEFFRIASEMAFEGQFGDDESSSFENVRHVYENWVSFFRRSRSMTDQIARGIFAELMFLEKIIGLGCEPGVAVKSWVGPFNAPQDFLFENGSAAEVKAVHPSSRSIRIASEFQLDFAGELILAVLTLESLEGHSAEGESLRELAARIKMTFASAPEVEDFDNCVRALGLNLDSKDGERRFKSHGTDTYVASTSAFPAVIASNLDNRIRKVEYSIARHAIEEFRTDYVGQWR